VVNYNVFYYLMAFLREVLQHGDKNKLQADKLGTLLAYARHARHAPHTILNTAQSMQRAKN
jgi:hypothetical protein